MAQERLFIDPRHDTVIAEKAILRAHQTVATPPRFQGRHHVGVKHVEEFACIRPFDQKLAEGGGIQQAERLAGVSHLAGHGLLNGFTAALIAIGAPPVADRLPIGAVGIMPCVHRRLAQRLERVAPRFACDRRHGDRRVRRAERGGAHLRNLFIQRFRKNCQTVNITQLTLICCHAERGIALGVLDTFKTLSCRQLHIRDLHIVLEVEPRLFAHCDRGSFGHQPNRLKRLSRQIFGHRGRF